MRNDRNLGEVLDWMEHRLLTCAVEILGRGNDSYQTFTKAFCLDGIPVRVSLCWNRHERPSGGFHVFLQRETGDKDRPYVSRSPALGDDPGWYGPGLALMEHWKEVEDGWTGYLKEEVLPRLAHEGDLFDAFSHMVRSYGARLKGSA